MPPPNPVTPFETLLGDHGVKHPDAIALLDRILKAKVPAIGSDQIARTFLDGFFNRIHKWVREIICCRGLSQIDTPEERERAADAIVTAIGAAVPPEYKLLWPLLRPIVRRIVLGMLETAANQGAHYCDGVACTLEPLAVKW